MKENVARMWETSLKDAIYKGGSGWSSMTALMNTIMAVYAIGYIY